jgi:predicted dehydrogenase
MGRRRIRSLLTLGYSPSQITGIDFREDRRQSAEQDYHITTVSGVTDSPTCTHMFVCTPPDKHLGYLEYASESGIVTFVEHGIFHRGLANLDPEFIKPSCTMLFHPLMLEIQSLAASPISNIIYHCGQNLHDWHPYEDIDDFYVSKRGTGGAREIVPFELTWMCDVFGVPAKAIGIKSNTSNIADIDDTYNIALAWGNTLGALTVDVVSRPAIRKLTIVATDGTTRNFDLNEGISEAMYVAEVKAFLSNALPNTLEKEIEVLKLLEKIEG